MMKPTASNLSRTNLPPSSKCLVFPDGGEWLVFLPGQGLVFRTNRTAAAMFSRGDFRASDPPTAREDETWAPTTATVSPTNRCGQACIYCYGTPAHDADGLIDPAFCEAGLGLVAANAAAKQKRMQIFFHGVGEPTAHWARFAECVAISEQAAVQRGADLRLALCTGGQLSEARAAFVAEHFDAVNVSIDGPADMQNAQRPRRDGRDSLLPAIRTAVMAFRAGREVSVKTTVTDRTVARLAEIVEFVAREIGPVRLEFGPMIPLPWVAPAVCAPPEWSRFIRHFGAAIDVGRRLGVDVGHPDVSLSLLAARDPASDTHFCLTPGNRVVAYYDVPREGAGPPELGVYGWYDRERGCIVFDHDRRKGFASATLAEPCAGCVCRTVCTGPGGVKGRMPEDSPPGGDACRARIGVLQELLKRLCPARKVAG